MSARIRRAETGKGEQKLPLMASPSGGHIPYPTIDKALLDYLRTQFTVRLSSELTLRDYDRMAGNQEVIEHLEALYLYQQNEG